MGRSFETSVAATDRRSGQVAQGFHGWLDRTVVEAERHRGERWRRDTSSTEAWLASLEPQRRRLAALLGVDRLPAAAEAPLRRVPVARLALGLVEQLSWQPWPGVTADALYVRPDETSRPVVIALHGLTGSPEAWLGLHGPRPESAVLHQLLAAGCGLVLPRLVAGWPARLRLARKARLLGYEWLGVEAGALQRLLDHLPTLPTVDPEAVGVYGFSRGGQAAMLLAALDERVAACGVASWFSHRVARLLDAHDARQSCYLDSPEDEQFVPGWLNEFSDLDLALLIAPEPLLITNGLDDPIVPFEQAEACFEPVAEVYARLGFADLCHLALLPAGHEPLTTPTVAFFARWLQPAPVAPLALAPGAGPPVGQALAPPPRRPRARGAAPQRRRRVVGRGR